MSFLSNMPLLHDCFACIHWPLGNVSRRPTKITFGSSTQDTFKRDAIPSQLKDLLVIIAQDGVLQRDLFRRPGNPKDIQNIIRSLQRGEKIDWSQYNFFTLANVAKRFLLSIKDGLLGTEAEKALIDTLTLEDDQQRIEAMHKILSQQPVHVQHLLSLLFGIWFRMIYHTDVNAMSVEAVAKSVAGSVFPSRTTSPDEVELASKVMEHLITGFASPDLFGHELIQYFAQESKTTLSRTEKFIYECYYAPNLSREECEEMFARMLLEESKKHNFHIAKNEVSKEMYDCFLGPSPSPSAQQLSRNDMLNNTKMTPRSSINSSQVHQTSEIITRVFLTVTDTVEEDAISTSSLVLSDSTPHLNTTLTPSTRIQQHHNRQHYHQSRPTPQHQHSLANSHRSNSTSRTSTSAGVAQGPSPSPQAELRSATQYTASIQPISPLQPGTQRFSVVRRRQQAHMEKRSAWFLSSPQGFTTMDSPPVSPSPTHDLVSLNPTRVSKVDSGDVDRLAANKPMLHLANTGVSTAPVHLLNKSRKGSHNTTLIPSSVDCCDYADGATGDQDQEEEESVPTEEMQPLCVRYFIVERLYAPNAS